MLQLQLGLTKTYNQFHNKDLEKLEAAVKNPQGFENLAGLKSSDFQKKYGKESYNLYNHLQKHLPNLPDFKNLADFHTHPLQKAVLQAITGIKEIRRLHVEMDNAVLEAYEASGEWRMVSSERQMVNSPLTTRHSPLSLNHNFYEVDYLPEGDNIRFTISPEARKEILKRLLELNHVVYAEEVKAGLWEKKGK